MTRRDDWRPRLHAWLNASARRPFVWGEHDCLTFAAGAVEAMTGENLAADMRGRYSTAMGAQRVLRDLGFGDVGDAVASRLPETERAREGDIVIVESEDGPACGVMGRGSIYVLRPDGLGLFDRRPLRVFGV